ncbi:MAG: protein phosphatase 2C domain-containing protein [Oscillospiraceae bacterium]
MLDTASVCNIGGREVNEDFVGILEDGGCACFAVVDAKGSSKVAETITKSILNDFKNSRNITHTSMEEFFDHAQDKMLDEIDDTDPLSPNIVTATAVSMLTDGNCAVWGHIGDSRLYHFKDNFIDEITPDHSAAYATYEAGQIKYGQIGKRRIRNQLYRTMGNSNIFNPEITNPTLIKENESFVLCTDGFWENISVRQMERTLKKSSSAAEWLDKMTSIVKKNFKKNRAENSHDNYSAIVIKKV